MLFFHGWNLYRPAELFDETGKLVPEIAEIAPKGDRRNGDEPNHKCWCDQTNEHS